MSDRKRIGVFGGTFDPIHFGHVHLLTELLNSKKFDEIIVIPAGDPWQKNPKVPGEYRFEMTQIALKELPLKVSDLEIKRNGPTYALDTYQELEALYGEQDFVWIIGSDVINSLSSWHEIERLAQSVEFLVVKRPHSKVDVTTVPAFVKYSEIEVDALDISATQVRDALANGDVLDGLIPDNVAQFIKSKGLYGAA